MLASGAGQGTHGLVTRAKEALSTTLSSKGIDHSRYLNAIVAVTNWAVAQRLAGRWATRRWARLLDGLARQVNPHLPMLRRAGYGPYWWVVDQAEVATDVAFASRSALQAVLPCLFAHAASAFSAEDVLRFLGRKLTPQLACEVTSSARRRPEGWRVKHTMARNSIKCYDKANVLRVETTINDPTAFRVLRIKNGHRVWCPMRKGVANLHRYYEVGRAANERYLEALAAAVDNTDAMRVLDRHCRPSATAESNTPASTPSEPTTSPCSGPPSPASTPSTGSATKTYKPASTHAQHATTPRSSAAAPAPPGSS